MYTQELKYEWDENKSKKNMQKHGISFEEAVLIFNRPVFTIEDKRHDYGETRFITVGEIKKVAVILVVNTRRDKSIRIISARKANKKERTLYYEYLKKKS